MPITEYNKVLNKKEPKFEGNNITKCCQEFLSKMLSKKLSKRFSVSQALADPWIVKSKIKIDEIKEKYSHDPEKMIMELNKCKVDDSFYYSETKFQNKKSSENGLETNDTLKTNKFLLSKRSRENE